MRSILDLFTFSKLHTGKCVETHAFKRLLYLIDQKYHLTHREHVYALITLFKERLVQHRLGKAIAPYVNLGAPNSPFLIEPPK
jgi:hypothetical protein